MKDYSKLFSGMADDAGEELKKIQSRKKPGKQATEKPKTIGKTASEKKRENRIKKRAERRAKKGGSDPDNKEQFAADVAAEKEKIGQRRANRKQFLRDFAANLAGVEQNQVRGQINTKDMSKAFGESEGSKPDAVKAQESQEVAQKETYDNIFKGIGSSGNASLGDIGFSTTNPYDLFKNS
jgi:hypothetical protein|tara:strand:+ start:967 stop:1509 length:543 start_codon:yes stop_codon:yes gene_type:complete